MFRPRGSGGRWACPPNREQVADFRMPDVGISMLSVRVYLLTGLAQVGASSRAVEVTSGSLNEIAMSLLKAKMFRAEHFGLSKSSEGAPSLLPSTPCCRQHRSVGRIVLPSLGGRLA
jgi:hypothetical protein